MDTCDVEIVQPEIDVSQQAVALIDDTIDASVETADPIIHVDAEEYVLSSGGIYGGNRLIGAVPDWILKAVEQQLTTGDGNLMSVLQDLQALMTSFQIGVNQQITSLNTDMYSQNGIITTISSQVEQNRADALSLISTKATPEYALAVATDAIQARFADEFGGVSAEAFIGSIASTYVDANSAIAQEVDLLRATLGDVSASITELDSVVVERVSALENSVNTVIDSAITDLQAQIDGQITTWFYAGVPSSTVAPENGWADSEKNSHLGDLYYDTDTGYAYRYALQGSNYVWIKITDIDTVKALADASRAQSTADGKSVIYYSSTDPRLNQNNVVDIGDIWVNSSKNNETKTWTGTAWAGNETKWSAESSKFITAPDGSITGWKMSASTGNPSSFVINADKFAIVATGQSVASRNPFTVNATTGEITFNGKVSFTNVTGAPVSNQTFVQTTAPTIGMVTGDTWVDTDDSNKTYTYNGTSWALNALGAKTYMQSDAPLVGLVNGDLWIDNNDGNKLYRYSSGSWIPASSASGNKTFYQVSTSTPSGAIIGDRWYQTDKYRNFTYTGSSWVLEDVVKAINGNNTTTIDGGLIATNTLHADRIVAGTIVADKIKANEITAGKIPYQELIYHDMRTGGGHYQSPTSTFLSNGAWHTANGINETFTIPSNFVPGSQANIRFICLCLNYDTGNNRKIQLRISITRVRNGTTFYVFPSYGSGPVVYDITIEDASSGTTGMRNINIEELVGVQAGDKITVKIDSLAVSAYTHLAVDRIVAIIEAYNKTGEGPIP